MTGPHVRFSWFVVKVSALDHMARLCPARSMVCAAFVAAALLAAATSRAQDASHGVTPADIERGGQIFLLSCASCHGPNGDTVPGVNLASGSFRRATTDQDLAALIRNGIPGTAMPPSSLTEAQALQVVAYLRSLPAAAMAASAARPAGPAGTPSRGQMLYATLDCASCHMVNGAGAFLGPDLSSVGITRRPDEIERALTNPDADIRNGARTVTVVRKDGSTIVGRLLNQDTYTLQFIDAAGRLTSIRKADARSAEVMESSAMPNYADKLSAQQVADLVSYLQTLNAPVRTGGIAGTGRGGPAGGRGGTPASGQGQAGGRAGRGATP
jgi:putative heme-binding domain-containing protein